MSQTATIIHPPDLRPTKPTAPSRPARSDDELSLDELAERFYGKSLDSQIVSMVDGFDLYKRMHVLLMEPPLLQLALPGGNESYAVDVAVAINNTFHNVEDSSTLGNPHKSYTWHQLLYIIVLFIAKRGNL